ncbi:MAG: hypothetical protein JWM23_746 [Microbacteriaceae bacterium]|jgi:DNA-binding SARP family transcriptional activator|nr:hypothetical protein [Microbacteriaceae bacterium]
MSVYAREPWQLELLGAWQLRRGAEVLEVPHRQQRLITVVAIKGQRSRSYLASSLWPDSSEGRAASSLRNTLWHMAHELPGLLEYHAGPIALADDVRVDVHDLDHQFAAVHFSPDNAAETVEWLRRAELLPGWYDDWVVEEQERLLELRLDSLESLARSLLAHDQLEMAARAALAARMLQPLRESAYQLLIQAYLESGNQAAALDAYQSLSVRLRSEWLVEPSIQTTNLVLGLLPNAAVHREQLGRPPNPKKT